MFSFVLGIGAGTLAFWLTIYKDMKYQVYQEALFWKQELRDFQEKVRNAINAAERKVKDENSKK